MASAQSIDVAFGRTLFRSTMAIVSKVTTVQERKDAWVYNHGRGHWEFHGPDEFYWHGSASTAADARASGWSAWWERLKENHDELVARLEVSHGE